MQSVPKVPLHFNLCFLGLLNMQAKQPAVGFVSFLKHTPLNESVVSAAKMFFTLQSDINNNKRVNGK